MAAPALSRTVLSQLVRLAQRHRLRGAWGDWKDFLKHAGPVKTHDPAKVDTELLKAFLSSLLHPKDDADGMQHHQDPLQPQYEKNTHFISRVIKRQQRIEKEELLHATSVPPSHRARHHGKGSSHSAAATVSVDAWQLVRDTRAHSSFLEQYQLPSYLPGWARTKRRALPPAPTQEKKQQDASHGHTHDHQGSVSAAPGSQQQGGAEPSQGCWSLCWPRLLALDCEMVQTEEPGGRSLVNLSVVDEQGQLVYSTYIRPRYPVVDYCTTITGLSAEDLQGITTQRSEARRRVKELLLESWRTCGVPTILVGHALSHDLAALRLDHQPCIDTALLFRYESLPECTPSLSDLCRVVLGREMPVRAGTGRHDSREDAWASMQLVLHELGRTQRTGPLPPPASKVEKAKLCQLLVHSIPAGTRPEEVLGLFVPMLKPGAAPGGGTSSDSECGDNESLEEETGEGGEATEPAPATGHAPAGAMQVLTQAPVLEGAALLAGGRRAVLVFKHAGEASAAFRALRGMASMDTSGLRQKEVQLPGSASGRVKVRMMAGHNGMKFFISKAQARHAAAAAAKQKKGTKRRRDSDQVNRSKAPRGTKVAQA